MGQSKRMEKDEKRDSWGHSRKGWKENKKEERRNNLEQEDTI